MLRYLIFIILIRLLEIQVLLRIFHLGEGVAFDHLHQLLALFALDRLLLLVGERDSPGIRRIEQRTVFVLQCGDRLAVCKRPSRGLLAGLWQLPDVPGKLETAGGLICRELLQVGRTEVTTTLLSLDEVPEFPQAERKTQTATVSSLRLDAVLAAMLHCSRGQACEWIAAGRVEINHLPAESAHAPVYEGDVFTVRGKGRFGLTALPGKSKKDRSIIEFFQY